VNPGTGARRAAELAGTARELTRLLLGARVTDGQGLASLDAEASASLQDARSTAGLPQEWVLGRRLTTVGDLAVVEVREGNRLVAVLKLSRSPAGDENLAAQQGTVHELSADERLGAWRELLPRVLAHGAVGARAYTLEAAVPGTVGTALSDGNAGRAAERAVRAAAELHRATGRAAVVGAEAVERWLQPGLSLLADVPMPLLGPARRRELTGRLRERVVEGTVGRTVWTSRTHGDFFPGNLFLGPSSELTGIIDWGQSRGNDLSLVDPMTYLLVARARRQGRPLGAVVRDLCREGRLTEEEQRLLDLHRGTCPGDPLAPSVAALLAWLRHAENNLLKSPRYAAHPVWVRRNLETVLRALA
jgi:Ser/Thr protein kinase RdoA (MazF antagonist)